MKPQRKYTFCIPVNDKVTPRVQVGLLTVSFQTDRNPDENSSIDDMDLIYDDLIMNLSTKIPFDLIHSCNLFDDLRDKLFDLCYQHAKEMKYETNEL